mmetsp:Transcript_26845/g.25898  ORF Transcript_26845/g.25898 Transcript_26845/m.25898 type:complete len:104 (-) Transcript_26845:517-828(-)
MITKPLFPQYVIVNNTGTEILYSQYKSDSYGERKMGVGEHQIFTWFDQTSQEKKIVIHVDGKSCQYQIDKIKKLKEFSTPNDTYYVQVKTKGDFRTIEVRSKS